MWLLLCLAPIFANGARGDQTAATAEKNATNSIRIADGAIALEVPSDWNSVKPRVNIVEYEFSIPSAEGDATNGRLTITSSGGGVKANIDRWKMQFVPPSDLAPEAAAKVEERAVDGMPVHIVELQGTFKDRRGPFAPAVERPDYRMLGAILETRDAGDYFFKFYGPQATIEENADDFESMIESIQRGGR